MSIKPSELIINDKGRIYHIDCGPDDLANTIITVGDPDRVKRVSKYFDKIEVIRSHREFVTHTGYIGNKRISVISTGIGPDNIDIVINEIDALFNINLATRSPEANRTSLKFIRIGTSGTLQRDIPVDSFIKSQGVFGLDNLMYFYQYEKEKSLENLEKSFNAFMKFEDVKAYAFMSSDDLSQKLGKGFIQGMTITCPGFYGPQGRKLRLTPRYNDFLEKASQWSMDDIRATNFEMETSAIYGLSHVLGHDALSLSAIIANRPNGTFSKDPYNTVESLIQSALAEIVDL